MVFREDGAKDWHTRLAISFDNSGSQHKLQFHHIFPKAFLDKKYEPKQVNDISNLAFITGGTNRKISAKDPAIYIEEIIKKQGKEIIEKQGVPLEVKLREVDFYPQFLDARRNIISNKLNKYIFNI